MQLRRAVFTMAKMLALITCATCDLAHISHCLIVTELRRLFYNRPTHRLRVEAVSAIMCAREFEFHTGLKPNVYDVRSGTAKQAAEKI